MVLSEGEIQQVFEWFKKADLIQLMALSSLCRQLLDARAKDGDEKLFLMLDFYEKDKRRRQGDQGGKDDES